MPVVHKYIPHYTYEDWLHWEGRWELIDGFPVAMSPSPTPAHQRASVKILSAFENAIEASSCNTCAVYNFIDYKISDDIILQPDALIVCGEIERILSFPPALVVEIISPSTALRDRNTKFQLYEQQGVKYYLMADIDKRKLEIFQLVNGRYEQVSDGTSFQLEGCSINPDLSKIFN